MGGWTNNNREIPMRKKDLEAMQFNELWRLHEEIARILADRIFAEKRELEKRLAQLNRGELEMAGEMEPSRLSAAGAVGRVPRRKYPRVLPKYRNPSSPSETWSGRERRLAGWLWPSRQVTRSTISGSSTAAQSETRGWPGEPLRSEPCLRAPGVLVAFFSAVAAVTI